MDIDMFTEFLARLQENRLTVSANNPGLPTSQLGLGSSEAKGNTLRQIQEIKQMKIQQAQMQQMQQMLQAQRGGVR